MLAKVEDPDQRAYEALLEKIEPLRHRLLHHSVYEHLDSIEAVRVFMEFHCYPVADFMCLLKSLQQRLTVLSVPWFPPVNTQAARFINEIVVAEESDEARYGGFISHYEMYIEAMREVGADTGRVEHFVEYVRNRQHYRRASACRCTQGSKGFRVPNHASMFDRQESRSGFVVCLRSRKSYS